MRTAHFRHLLDLSWQKISLVVLFVLVLASPTWAQKPTKRKDINLPDYDARPGHYGFHLGVFNGTFQARTSEGMPLSLNTTNYTITSVQPLQEMGFVAGFNLNRALGDELWSIRFLPNFSYHNRAFRFDLRRQGSAVPIDTAVTKLSEALMLEIPVMFKYKSLRRLNHRFYLTGGVALSFASGSGRNSDDPTALAYGRSNLEICYGFGLDAYMQLFKFAPEVRFYHGLSNMISRGANPFNQSISNATTHRIALILNFE